MIPFDDVPRETQEQLALLYRLIKQESQRQNLVSASTLAESAFYERHIKDSAQLLRFAPTARSWLDIGSGAGLPGLVLALLSDARIVLVEPRRRRAEFLIEATEKLALTPRVRVVQTSVQTLPGSAGPFEAITARAVASLSALFEMAEHLAASSTTWVLPKGRTASEELASAQQAWQGVFRTELSRTALDSAIVIATDVRRRGAR